MKRDNWRAILVTLTTRLPFTLGWLLGDAEWAIGGVRGAHGHECGNVFRRSGGMVEGAPDRLMAAYLTWRGIPGPADSCQWRGVPNNHSSHRRSRARTAMRQWPA